MERLSIGWKKLATRNTTPEDFEKESQRESQRTSTAAMMTFFEG